MMLNSFFAQNYFNLSELKRFTSKNTINVKRTVESEIVFTAEMSFICEKMLFTEDNETNIRNLHSLFLAFVVDEVFFDKFLLLQRETGKANSSFYCLLTTTNLNIRL